MTCSRCQGCLVQGYDEIERWAYVYCVNCGHRPMQQPWRADGLKPTDPLPCVKCGKGARALLRKAYGRAEADEGLLCEGCRGKRKAQYFRRKAKKRKEKVVG